MRTVYKTRQRDIILEMLKNNINRQMTAEEICLQLRSEGNSIGTATVYRYLEKLYEDGKLHKYTQDRKGASYSYREKICREHFHLRCTDCGELFCADCDFLEKICDHIKGDHGFVVDCSKTVLYGVCEKCKTLKTLRDKE